MKSRRTILALVTCLFASPLLSRADDLDNDCRPVTPPASSAASPCHAIWLDIQDIKQQIHDIGEALQGRDPSGRARGAPSGPQKADLLKQEQALYRALGAKEGELGTCEHIRRAVADVDGGLDGTGAFTIPGFANDQPLAEAIHAGEFRIHFSNKGCTASLRSLPVDSFRTPTGHVGPTVTLTSPTAPSGSYHPVTGALSLTFNTTIEFHPGLGGGATSGPLPIQVILTTDPPGQPVSAAHHVRLVGAGTLPRNQFGTRYSVLFEGTLSPVSPP